MLTLWWKLSHHHSPPDLSCLRQKRLVYCGYQSMQRNLCCWLNYGLISDCGKTQKGARHRRGKMTPSIFTDWLSDWLSDWLIDWLTDWLSDWLTVCSFVRSFVRSFVHSFVFSPFPTTRELVTDWNVMWCQWLLYISSNLEIKAKTCKIIWLGANKWHSCGRYDPS